MQAYCKLNPWEHISVKFEYKYNNFNLYNGDHFVSTTMCKAVAGSFSLTVRHTPCTSFMIFSIMSEFRPSQFNLYLSGLLHMDKGTLVNAPVQQEESDITKSQNCKM